MLPERKKSYDSISRTLSILKFDIQHHQTIGDYSLNIHGENYFRDLFNFIYEANFKNINHADKNSPSIDLLDDNLKIMYQITTTRDLSKVENTFKIYGNKKFSTYSLRIYYLLDKPNFAKKTIDTYNKKFKVNLKDIIMDSSDLLKDINNLTTDKLIELDRKYFKSIEDQYTDQKILNVVVDHLLIEKPKSKKDYTDDFGSIETDKKILLNNINERIKSKINDGLDYSQTLEKINDSSRVLTELRELIVNDYYRSILFDLLKPQYSKLKKTAKVKDLHLIAKNLDFNKVMAKLHDKIEYEIKIKDFNSMNVGWVIISFFFEICDVGRHK
ncbi:SMEK domain-containing protein [Leptospira meyeri]|uniref:SMEK domain-containing protein n=1 Tax=Leptospira meyeri TaxID=29508 RepID=UPI000C2A9490|nr:SMEK domain-containing protein [Leptospira meyeri]PJZ79279.1 hypothetical protein CH359_19090 [Leptospira meyeri]PJZ95113.1 hypothetical protein CH358_19050 [Leptospira meyeri]